MDCKKALSRLGAYVDGEMSADLMQEMEEHLDGCPFCRNQMGRIRQVEHILDSLSIPPVPQEFAARIMAEARRRAPLVKEKKSFPLLEWHPLQWLLDLSPPMRVAACTALLLACLLGVFMSKEVSQSGSRQSHAAETQSLDGFEWFSPTPPSSLGSAYLTLASNTPEDQNTR